jgi:hypothetical protein
MRFGKSDGFCFIRQCYIYKAFGSKNHVRQSRYGDHRLLHSIKKGENNKTINIHKTIHTHAVIADKKLAN